MAPVYQRKLNEPGVSSRYLLRTLDTETFYFNLLSLKGKDFDLQILIKHVTQTRLIRVQQLETHKNESHQKNTERLF